MMMRKLNVFLVAAVMLLVLGFAGAPDAYAAGPFARMGHSRMVAASGIRPARVGSYEGVGRSTAGYAAAVRAACYWGQRTPLSIQYSKRGSMYYAVVRYR